MAQERRTGETLTFAKFQGTCTDCGDEINVNAAIWSNKYKGTARHKKCPIEKKGKSA